MMQKEMQKKAVSVVNFTCVPKFRVMPSRNFILTVEFSSNLKGISIKKRVLFEIA